jgi:uncharacterized protein (DUF433 family)
VEDTLVHAGEFFLILLLNCIVIFVLYFYQKRLIEKNIKHLKEEVHELEDLVAAIIEEFEDIADTNVDQAKPGQISASNQELGISYPTVGDFLDNMEESDFNETVEDPETSRKPLNQVNMANDTAVNVTADSLNQDAEVDESAADLDKIEEETSVAAGTVDVKPEVVAKVGLPVSSKPGGSIQLETINDPRHRRILELRQQGVTVEEIARQLKTGRGEIQLVLGLYRRS